jgi:superkiller protein 3
VVTWQVAPRLLPARLPADFPQPPDLGSMNPDLRALVESADREARRRPGSAEAVGKLGVVYHANLLLEQAEAAYRIAARLAPDDAEWAYAQAALEEEKGGGKEQLKFLEDTLRLKPGHVPAMVKLADWHFKVDRLEEAAKYYGQASRAVEGGASLQATFGLGRVAARRREWNRVVEIVEPLTRSYPHAAPFYELLREAYEGLGQAEKAAQARQSSGAAKWKTVPPFDDPFNEQLAGHSRSSTRLLKHAGLLSRSGLAERAVDAGRRAAQADPKDPDVRNFLARTLLTFYPDKPEMVDEAIGHVAECLRLRPGDPVPLGGFADDFFKSPKRPEAVERVRALLRSFPKAPGMRLLLGQAADALGETGEAEAEYRAALKENPKDAAAHNRLGLIAEKRGKGAEATGHFRKAIQLNPESTAARLNLAIAVMEHGGYAEGLKELDELLRINPHDAAAHFCMGFAFLSLKRTGEAIGRFRQGLLYKPDDAEARFGLGLGLASEGKREEARAELREALRLNPGHERARRLAAELGN